MAGTRPLTDLNEAVIEKIKTCATAQDESGMRALLRSRECGSEEIAQAIYRLSMSGGALAIEFLHPLIGDYPLHVDRLVQLHAACNYSWWVDELLTKYHADINSAVTGYAYSGLWLRVHALLGRGADKKCAAYGYAYSCHTALIERLLDNDFEQYITPLVTGFEEGGHFASVESVTRLFALIDSGKLRNELQFWLEKKFPDKADAILAKAVDLNRIKRKYQMSYEMTLELYDNIKAIEARHQPWFYVRFFAPDNPEVENNIRDDVLGLMNDYEKKMGELSLKRV